MPVTQILTTAGRISGPQVGWGSIAYTAVDEGQQNTVYLNLNRWDNSDVYWYLVDSGNTAISNSTQVTPNAGVLYSPGTGNFSQSFNFTFNNDVTADGTLTYYIRIENAAGDLLVPRKGPFTCNDTSFSLGQYTFNGTPTAWATTNAASPTYGAYTYPDETSGSLHTLTGSQFVLSGSLGKSPTVNINLWFYPTANNKLIMGEVGQSQENTGWHYSMLEIDSTNHLKGRIWEMSTGPFPTSVGTVTLNAWNHVHLYFDNSTSTFGMSLNNETAVTRSDFTRHVPDVGYVGAYYGIGMYETQFMSAQDRYEGKFDTPVIDTTLTGSNYSSTKAKYLPPSSLVFVENQGDYLEAAGSSDWNLGDTWTIEFYLNADAPSATANGGIWGLLNQVGWSTTNAIVVALSDNKLVYLSRAWNANDDVRYTEPTPGQWTHVAIANDAGTQKVFYNGAEQTRVSGNVGSASYTNGSSPLRIGRLGPANGGTLNGKMALVRISNTAKYTAPFTPTTTYGVEADTKLFLSLTTPLVDSMSHTITNNGVTLSTTVPATFAPLSLLFGGDASPDYLTLPASSDWNLGTTWTIEFWSKSNIASTGLAGPYAIMAQQFDESSCVDVFYYNGKLCIKNGTGGIYDEPTPGVWTHVALSSSSGALTVYYNGVLVYTGASQNYALSNTSLPLYIGRRVNFQHFNGRLALVRISNTAKYATAFNPSITYGVEADTKLFLGGAVPLIDAKGHAITNTSVTLSTDFPVTITITNVSVGFNSRAATVDFTSTVSQAETATIFFEWSGGGAYSGPHTLTVNPGSNTYTSPMLSLAGAGNNLTTEITIASGPNACTSNIYTGSWSVICLVEGTMVTMADGSYKAIEDIRYNDLLRVWNFDLGEFSEALPVFVKQEETHAEHYRFTFSDGTVLRTVGHHVFNKQAGAFTMLVRNTTPVGTITFNEFGEEVTLIAKEIIEEPVRFYNVWTQYHLNLFADSILTSNRFNNIYPIQDMKFVKDNRALRPLEEFANIDPKYISGLRLQEQPAQYTAEYIRDYVESKLERLDIANTTVIT